MSLTNYARNKIMDYNFGQVTYTLPSSYFLGLSTTTISSSGSNCTEPTDSAYERVQIDNGKSASGFTISANGCLVNAGDITFPMSSASWGTIVDVALFDSPTSGSIWYYTTLGTPKIVQDNTTISLSASAISISMA